MTTHQPRKLLAGEKVYLKFGTCRHGVVTADQGTDDYILFALETDDPSEPGYGRRIARRGEVSPISEPAPLATALGELLKVG
jgi:hypothetical protein